MMKILILSGSFHSKSRSLRLAEFTKRHLCVHSCDIPLLQVLPFYSEDLNIEKPEIVSEFIQAVAECDGIICITPEYNHSIPAVLKNAIDWASRPAFSSPLKDKPVAIVTQAESAVGGARVQAHLKLVFDSTLSVIFPSHEMMITSVSNVIDEKPEMTDADSKRRLIRYLDEFVVFAQRFAASD